MGSCHFLFCPQCGPFRTGFSCMCCDYRGWHQHSVFKPHRLLNYGIKTSSNGFKQICKIVKPPLFGDGRPPFLSCSNTFDLYTQKNQIIFLKLRWQLWNQVRKLGSLSHLSKVGVNYQKLGQSTIYAFFVVLCCVVVFFCCFLLFFFFHIWSDWQWSQVNKVLKSSVRLIFSFMTRKTDLCLSLVFLQELSLFPYSKHILFTG